MFFIVIGAGVCIVIGYSIYTCYDRHRYINETGLKSPLLNGEVLYSELSPEEKTEIV